MTQHQISQKCNQLFIRIFFMHFFLLPRHFVKIVLIYNISIEMLKN